MIDDTAPVNLNWTPRNLCTIFIVFEAIRPNVTRHRHNLNITWRIQVRM